VLAALPLLRGVHLLCLVSLLGTLTARCAVAPGFDVARVELVRLARLSLLLAVPTLLGWLLLQAASFADSVSLDGAIATLPVVLLRTRFGHVLSLRLVLLGVVWPLVGRGRMACICAVVLAAAALALQADLGHAGAAAGGEGDALLASESLHLIAAGAWLGGLLPLLVMTLRLPRPLAAAAAQRFTAVGLPAVLVLMATALVQGNALVGGIPGLFGTTYGHLVLVKLGLFAVLLGLAMVNRFVLTARFEQGRTGHAVLAAAIGIEALAGGAVVMAAAVLASQEPGLHAEPVWPFPLRSSTAALADPDIAREITLALAAMIFGAAVLVAGMAWRRGRWPMLAAGLAVVILAAPHLRPLLVEAYPTSYMQSPTGFAAASIVRGAAVYAANCVGCHGPTGRGDGPQAKTVAIPPANLTEAHLWDHSDGELFWWLTHGMDNPEGGLSMPGFASALSADDRWAAIDFIRANNAGQALRTTGAWPVPVAAPGLPLVCADGGEIDMAALRGRPVQVLADLRESRADAAVGPGLATVHLARAPGADRPTDGCQAATPDAWPAYAILTGATDDSLAGTLILVDAAGWLRSVIRSDGETDIARQEAALLAEIEHHPIAAPTTTDPKLKPSGSPAARVPRLAIAGLLVAVLLLGAAAVVLLTGHGGDSASRIGGPFALLDGDGKTVTDRDFRGKFMLVYFGYSYCPDVCPTTLNEIADAMDKLGPMAARVQPIFITVDPKRDTPAVIKQYAANFSPKLLGLTGSPEQIATVAKEYRVYYAEHRTGPGPSDYSMDHSSIIYLMGPNGQFIEPIPADETAATIVSDIQKAVS
jgi:cytochrome oxidase Cu insertion factor (SCO1/SenC/PrrC family)/putative copper export protein/mono/diheme cytochrome c family protein